MNNLETEIQVTDPYERLIRHIRNWLFGLPDSGILRKLIKTRFTPEEAEFLSRFPHRPTTLDQLCEHLQMTTDELLITMAPVIKKGFVCEFESSKSVRYAFTDPIFFYYRMPGWKGESDKWNREIAPLLNQYYTSHLGANFLGAPTKGLRAIPVAQTIKDPRQILPYEDILSFVDQEDYHCVTTCACKHRHNLDPNRPNCKHETENCLHFGKLGRYIVKHNMGRQITREETFEILNSSADAGLVHGITNSKRGMDTICNCCSCCCLFLESVKSLQPISIGHQRSNYILSMNDATCKKCGLCVQRCPMNALELAPAKEMAEAEDNTKALKTSENMTVVYDQAKCIGCGVCAYKCPTQSLNLVRKDQEEDIPENMSEAGNRMLAEMGLNPKTLF
jgi:formate hydrogenlyase subunit 6/NADH:ubiquinone oxidoreductase subunit I